MATAPTSSPRKPPVLWDAVKSAKWTDDPQDIWWLLHKGAHDIEERGGDEGNTPLHEAVSWGLEKIALLLLEHRANVSATNTAGRTPLHHAARQNKAPIMRLLLEHGAEATAQDHEGRTALHIASFHGNTALAETLMQHGAVVSHQGTGGTPLHAAAYSGHAAVCLLLLERGGADIAAKAKATPGWTPLHSAASKGHEAVVQLLIEHGADVLSLLDSSPEGLSGPTPEEVATVYSHLQTAAILKAEALRRAKCEAFAMGQLERLGAGSRVRSLDPGVARMVLDHM